MILPNTIQYKHKTHLNITQFELQINLSVITEIEEHVHCKIQIHISI